MRKNENKRGMVLIMAVILAGAAAILASALVAASTSRLKNVGQTHSFEQAFFIADAGIQRAKAQTSSDNGFGPARLGPDGYAGTSDDGVFAFGASVDFAEGTYAVRGQPGVTMPPGISVNTNLVLVVLSTGAYNNVERVIEAALFYEPPIPLPSPTNMDGALAYYGTNAYLKLLGAPIKVDGRDWDVPVDFYADGNASWGTLNAFKPPVPSSLYSTFPITVDGPAAAIYAAVAPNPPERIRVGGGNYSNEYWSNFVVQVAAKADRVVAVNEMIVGDATLGTREDPIILVIKSGAELSGVGTVNGAGILIVEHNAALRLTGNFRFEGLVIGIGSGIVSILGSGNPTILGATIAIGDNASVTVNGTPNISYSSQALANLANLDISTPNVEMVWWREIKE